MLDLLKFIIILLNGLFVFAFISEGIKDKKRCHLFIIMGSLCIANIVILWLGL
jgi:hypothetical protein